MADENINEDVNPDQTEDQVTDSQDEENTEDTPETPDEENTDAQDESDNDESNDEDQNDENSDDEESNEEDEDSEETESEYNEYEHPALKQAVSILEESGLPVDEANAIFSEAVESGDLTKIKKDVLIEKIGKDKADVVLVLAESYYNTAFSGMKAIKEEAFSLTGGEENFNAMRDWANEKAKTDEDFAKDLTEFRAMLDSGQPRAIKAAVRELFDTYKQDPDTTIAADLEVGDKAASTAGVEPMSRADYIKAVEKAHKDGTYDQVHKSLWARRMAGKKKGI